VEDSIGGRLSRLPALTALLLATIFLLACDSGGDDSTTSASSPSTTTSEAGSDQPFTPNVVADLDIEVQEEGSPGRALLEWWQAYQFQDADGVELLTSEATLDEVGANRLAELVKTRGGGLQGIEVLSATESGDSAAVRVGLLTFTPEKEGDPPPEAPTAAMPDTFAMVKEGDAWLFDDPAFLEPLIEAMEAAEEDGGSN
jgi:hypothetical protein